MRYAQIDDVVFDDYFRGEVTIKNIRPIPTEEVAFETNIGVGETLDSVAVRPDVFGENGELQTYRLFDLNVRRIVANDFDLSVLKRIKIPK